MIIFLLDLLLFLFVPEEAFPIVGVPKNMEDGDDGHGDAGLHMQELDSPKPIHLYIVVDLDDKEKTEKTGDERKNEQQHVPELAMGG